MPRRTNPLDRYLAACRHRLALSYALRNCHWVLLLGYVCAFLSGPTTPISREAAFAGAAGLAIVAGVIQYFKLRRDLAKQGADLVFLKWLDDEAVAQDTLVTARTTPGGPFSSALELRAAALVTPDAVKRALPKVRWKLATLHVLVFIAVFAAALWHDHQQATATAEHSGKGASEPQGNVQETRDSHEPGNTASARGPQDQPTPSLSEDPLAEKPVPGEGSDADQPKPTDEGTGEKPKEDGPKPGENAGNQQGDAGEPAPVDDNKLHELPANKPIEIDPKTGQPREAGQPQPWEALPKPDKSGDNSPPPSDSLEPPAPLPPQQPGNDERGSAPPPKPEEDDNTAIKDVNVVPVVGDGERKSVRVRRDVYDPEAGTAKTPAPKPGETVQPSGIPETAKAPERDTGYGTQSDAEREWANEWARKFGKR